LQNALRAIDQLDYPNYEILVVNGPSQDSTTEVLERWAGRVRVLNCPEANVAASRNIAIAAAGGEIIAFIDDDAAPHPKWLSYLVPKYADDRVGGVGGFTVDNTGRRFQSQKVLGDRYGNAFPVSALFDERSLNRVGTPLYPSLLGTNCSFRYAALTDVGGFDGSYAYFLDETDLCLRLVDAGYQLLFEPSALVFHQFASSGLRTPLRVKRTYYFIARSKAFFAMRHGTVQSVEQAGKEINNFREEALAENESLLNAGVITSSHRTSLDQDVLRGISDGVAAATAKGRAFNGDLIRPRNRPAWQVTSPKPRMRVALVSQSFSPSLPSGIGRWTAVLAQGLAESGHVVHVIARGDEPSSEFEGYWIHRVPDDPIAGELVAMDKDIPNPIAARAAAVRQAIQYVKSFGLDIVSFPIWDVEGIAAVDEKDLAFAMSLHTTFGLSKPFVPEWHARPLLAHFEVAKMIAAEHRLLEEVPLIIANSKHIVDDLATFSGKDFVAKAHIVPHGTPDPFDRKPSRRGMRLPSRSPVKIVYAGRFEYRKGFDIAASVFDRLLRMNVDVEIDMVGDELSTAHLSDLARMGVSELLVNPRARVGDILDRDALDDLLASAHIVLIPSRYESFGLVAIEAMAAGAPVVALRTGGLSEVVEDGITGRLVDPDGNEVNNILSVLSDLIRNRELRERMAHAARSSFEGTFRVQTMVAGIEATLMAGLKVQGRAK
jgi:hypothetical protein